MYPSWRAHPVPAHPWNPWVGAVSVGACFWAGAANWRRSRPCSKARGAGRVERCCSRASRASARAALLAQAARAGRRDGRAGDRGRGGRGQAAVRGARGDPRPPPRSDRRPCRRCRPRRSAPRWPSATEPAASADPVATLQGTLSLLAAAAEERPQLLLIDDLQWLDRPRRTRSPSSRGARASWRSRSWSRSGPGPEPAPPGMTRARGVRTRRCRLPASCSQAPAWPPTWRIRWPPRPPGIPLALHEIPKELSAAQREGSAPLTSPLPAGPTPRGRLRVAAGGPPRGDPPGAAAGRRQRGHRPRALARALEAGGTGLSDLAPAEDAGLVRLDAGAVTFTHPLVRSAAYHGASGRRAPGRPPSPSPRRAGGAAAAWHRAAAAEGPDLEVAAAARGGGRRGGGPRRARLGRRRVRAGRPGGARGARPLRLGARRGLRRAGGRAGRPRAAAARRAPAHRDRPARARRRPARASRGDDALRRPDREPDPAARARRTASATGIPPDGRRC